MAWSTPGIPSSSPDAHTCTERQATSPSERAIQSSSTCIVLRT
jgi:hypothetical protein